MHNCLIHHRETGKPTKHCKERETPLPVYLGILLHTKTHKRSLVDDLGLCISGPGNLYWTGKHDLSPLWGWKSSLSSTTQRWLVYYCCNSSSTSAYDSFHGTGISLFQHPDDTCSGVQRSIAAIPIDSINDCKRKLAQLPDAYTNVPPVALLKKVPPLPQLEGPSKADCKLIYQAMQEEYRYIIFVMHWTALLLLLYT